MLVFCQITSLDVFVSRKGHSSGTWDSVQDQELWIILIGLGSGIWALKCTYK